MINNGLVLHKVLEEIDFYNYDLSGFDIRVIIALYSELVPSSAVFWKSLRKIGTSSSYTW